MKILIFIVIAIFIGVEWLYKGYIAFARETEKDTH